MDEDDAAALTVAKLTPIEEAEADAAAFSPSAEETPLRVCEWENFESCFDTVLGESAAKEQRQAARAVLQSAGGERGPDVAVPQCATGATQDELGGGDARATGDAAAAGATRGGLDARAAARARHGVRRRGAPAARAPLRRAKVAAVAVAVGGARRCSSRCSPPSPSRCRRGII